MTCQLLKQFFFFFFFWDLIPEIVPTIRTRDPAFVSTNGSSSPASTTSEVVTIEDGDETTGEDSVQ